MMVSSMKRIFQSLAISILCAFGVTPTAVAQIPEFTPEQCQGYVSYYLLPSGQCVNLTAFTELGNALEALAAAEREVDPIVAENFRLRRSAGDFYYLTGELRNQSTRTLWVNRATFRFRRRLDGQIVDTGLEQVAVVTEAAPGAAISIDWPISNPPIVHEVILESVEYWDS